MSSARPALSRAAVRRTAGAGAAGLAAVLAAAPLAHAAPSPTHDSGAKSTKDGTAAPSTKPAKKVAVQAYYGYQKYRVGVQVKSGSYVPPGTTTAGTVLHVVETGPSAGDSGRTSFDCTTVDPTPEDSADPTFCPGEFLSLAKARARAARVGAPVPALTIGPTPPNTYEGFYYPGPGDTVTVTQKSVNANLVADPATATLAPCEVPEEFDICTTGTSGDGRQLATDLVFDDKGPPPVATDDRRTTKQGQAIDIKVTSNDGTLGAPVTGLAVGDDPSHGTATVLAGSSDPVGPTPTAPAPATSTDTALARPAAARRAAAAPAAAAPAAVVVGSTIRYTPKAGFSGKDTFTYRLSTVNGTATATVTVTILAAAASSSSASAAPSSSATPAASSSSSNLASTGSNSQGLGELALGLLVAGGVATAAGRRRRVAARHARTG